MKVLIRIFLQRSLNLFEASWLALSIDLKVISQRYCFNYFSVFVRKQLVAMTTKKVSLAGEVKQI